MPSRNPTSPMRFTTNALRPAAAFAASVNQNPMSRYEQSPTPSQPTKRIGRLAPVTSSSIENVKRFRYAK